MDWKCLWGTSKPLLLPPDPEVAHATHPDNLLTCTVCGCFPLQDGGSVQGVQEMPVSMDSTP